MSAPEIIAGTADLLLLCDHASAAVPADIDLGVGSEVMGLHIAVDIGAAALTRALAAQLGAPAILGSVSRLVIDLHREPDHPALIPVVSDGHDIPGNASVARDDRIARFHAPYHHAIASRIRASRPRLLVAVHSFTRRLESGDGVARPWDAGILYNRDTRAARLAIDALRAQGIATGDNEPYSGRLLNATLNRHGEARGVPCFSIEVCNDRIDSDAGVAEWAALLEPIITQVRNMLAPRAASAT